MAQGSRHPWRWPNAKMNLDAAYRNFYRNPKTGFPKFKSKRSAKKSYTTNNQKGSIRITGPNTIRLPKLKDIKIKMHRPYLKTS